MRQRHVWNWGAGLGRPWAPSPVQDVTTTDADCGPESHGSRPGAVPLNGTDTILDTPEPGSFTVPEARRVLLPGRGELFVRDIPGPPGAPTLLLLHGWTATADLNFGPFYSPLAQSWRIVAMDHRGHGRGLRCPDPFRLEDCADDAVAVLDALGISETVALGYSMGGPIALLAWSRHRQRIRGLVLCATSSVFVNTRREAIRYHLFVAATTATKAVPAPVSQRLLEGLCATKAQEHSVPGLCVELSRHHWPTLLQAGCVLGRFRADQWLGQVDVPTAVVVTLDDEVLPARHQLELSRLLPNSTVHHIRAGHDVCLTAPEDLFPVLRDACDSVRNRLGHPRFPATEEVA